MPDYTLHRRCADYIACNTPPINSDLGITKEALDTNGDPVVDYLAGETIVFVLTVENAGPDDEPNAVVTDVLPACVTLVSDTPSVGTYDSATGEWVIGPMVSGDVQTLELEVTVGACKPDNLVNTAVVTGENPDPNPDNNEDSTDTPPRPTSLTAVDDGPVTASPNTPGVVDLCANDNNPEGTAIGPVTSVCGQAITAGGSITTTDGTYTLAADGCTLSFAPAATAQGQTIVCEYEVTDAEGDTSAADVTFVVTDLTAVDDGPVAVESGTTATVDLCANDMNPEGTAIGDVTSICGQAIAAGGSVTTADGTYALAADGCTLSFTPLPAAVDTTVTCEYEVTDAEGDTSAADVVFTVTGPKPTRVTSISDTDPAAYTINPAGSTRCDGSAPGGTDCFITLLGKEDVCNTYDPSITNLNGAHTRASRGSVIPAVEITHCMDGTMTFDWKFAIDPVDQAAIEAEFSNSGGVVTFNNGIIDNYMVGQTGGRVPVGSNTDYHATVFGIPRGQIFGDLDWWDAPEWVVMEAYLEDNSGVVCPAGTVSEDEEPELHYAKHYKHAFFVKNSAGTDASIQNGLGTGGHTTVDGYGIVELSRYPVAFSNGNVDLQNWMVPTPLSYTVAGDTAHTGGPFTIMNGTSAWTHTPAYTDNTSDFADGHYKDRYTTVNAAGMDTYVDLVHRTPMEQHPAATPGFGFNPSNLLQPQGTSVVIDYMQNQSRIEPGSAFFFDADVVAGTHDVIITDMISGDNRLNMLGQKEPVYQWIGTIDCGPQVFRIDEAAEMEILDNGGVTHAPASATATGTVDVELRHWFIMNRFF